MRGISTTYSGAKGMAYSAGATKSLLADGAQAWGTSPAIVTIIVLLPFLICLCGVAAALMGKEAYKAFTGEDRIAENIQVILWVVSFVFSFNVVQNQIRRGKYSFAALYVLLCAGIFFIIGEEISWGQRLLGWETPEKLKMMNKQNETNIHNIHGIGDAIKWLHLVVGAYGTFLPLIVWRYRGRLESFRTEISMLVPHYTMLPYFFIPFLWRIYRNLFEVPKQYYFAVSEYSEVMELIIAFAFTFFLVFQYRQMTRTMASSDSY